MANTQRRKTPRVAAPKSKGERMCAACRERAPREALLRFVVDPEGQVWVDPFLKAPGRGIHLCYSPECLALAVKKRAFQQSLKRPLPPVSLEQLTERVLEGQRRKIEAALTLSRRRQVSLSGLNLLLPSAPSLKLLILAEDIAPQSASALTHKVSCEVFTYGDSAYLGKTQGKEKRVAVGLQEEALATSLAQELNRYQQLLVASSEPKR